MIDEAIKIEQQQHQSSQLQQALELYRQGRTELKTALSIRFTANEWQSSRLLDTKMRRVLMTVQERIDSLTSKVQLLRTSSNPAPQATQSSANSSKRNNGVIGVDKELANRILDELLVVDDAAAGVQWDQIAGLRAAKKALQETIILPALRPDLYTGLRSPVRGILLYGPPGKWQSFIIIYYSCSGTGKTMLAKAVASQSKQKFFAISASTLTSKWLGEGEKLVKALFSMARELQPSIIFIDEIDSLLTGRGQQGEHEASRRLKTEFLVQFDGVQQQNTDRILVMAATNRPYDLDEAAIRRFPKRLYIPLPETETRKELLSHLLTKHRHRVSMNDLNRIVKETDGYSCSDLTALAKEAALGPLRDLSPSELQTIDADKVRPIEMKDYREAIKIVRPSVDREQLRRLEEWGSAFGAAGS